MDARNIADSEVLADIAIQHGWSRIDAIDALQNSTEIAVTNQAVARSVSANVRGVPHYLINGIPLSGHQSEQAFSTAIEEATKSKVLNA
jgi:predicted DsbA family dithiol-disulfide isomerase